MKQIALALARRNLAVFPLTPGRQTPAFAGGFKIATTDPTIINAWWDRCDYNIGIATGAVSNVFVIDVDMRDGVNGEHELGVLEVQHGELPKTAKVISGGGGRHLYFRHPNIRVPCSASKIAPGIDVRGDGGYVVAAGSLHPSGRRYRWSVDSASNFAEAPAWLITMVTTPATSKGAGTPRSEWNDIVCNYIPEGRRNATIARLTGLLLRRYVDPTVVLELMHSFNTTHCTPPLSPKEVQAIVNSISGMELRRRTGG